MHFFNTVMRFLAFLLIIVYILSVMPQTQSFSRDDLFVNPGPFVYETVDINKTSFTDDEKKLIMQIHNAYRSHVYPSATDMKELIWDDDLEEYAYNHTQTCTGAHSNRTMVKKFKPNDPATWVTWKYMAENLYYSFAPKYSLRHALYMFWAEGKDYDIITDNCTHPQTCGHYQAMILAQSSRIGCALYTCDQFSVSKYPTPAIYVACSYDGEHLDGVRPYTVGEECSDCSRETLGYDFQHCRHRLCVSPAFLYTNIGYDGNNSVIGLDEIELPENTTDLYTPIYDSTIAPEPEETTTLEASNATTQTTVQEDTIKAPSVVEP